jgi:MFS family permease
MEEIPLAGEAVKYCYIGLSIGDLTSGLISQRIKSRKKAVALFIVLTAISIVSYFTFANLSLETFYIICLILGFSIGYWAVFVTIAAENFGTNIRATVTTSVPNFIRGSVVPMTIVFQELKTVYSISISAMIIGFSTILIALISLAALKETYGKELNYIE